MTEKGKGNRPGRLGLQREIRKGMGMAEDPQFLPPPLPQLLRSRAQQKWSGRKVLSNASEIWSGYKRIRITFWCLLLTYFPDLPLPISTIRIPQGPGGQRAGVNILNWSSQVVLMVPNI